MGRCGNIYYIQGQSADFCGEMRLIFIHRVKQQKTIFSLIFTVYKHIREQTVLIVGRFAHCPPGPAGRMHEDRKMEGGEVDLLKGSGETLKKAFTPKEEKA